MVAACSASSPSSCASSCPWVGGGFGPKAAVYVEYLVAARGRSRARPSGEVDRDPLRGHGLARHGRDYVMTAKLGTHARRQDHRARRQVVAAGGAYPAIGAILPMLTQMMSVGVYDMPEGRTSTP